MTKGQNMGCHHREPWGDRDTTIVKIAASYVAVKGSLSPDPTNKKRYEAAKKKRDHDAAREIIDDHVDDNFLDAIVEDLRPHLEAGKRIIVVHPNPKFNGDDTSTQMRPITNAIPLAFAELICENLGAEKGLAIVQAHRPGRTNLAPLERLVFQPKFEGPVDRNAVYVLVDDVYTLGGTLAMLRSHIIESGGTIGGVYVLAHARDAKQLLFGIDLSTLAMLMSRYGIELNDLWLKEIGHEVSQLTACEGKFLRKWEPSVANDAILHRIGASIRKIRFGHE